MEGRLPFTSLPDMAGIVGYIAATFYAAFTISAVSRTGSEDNDYLNAARS
ncbi:hypothetical protein QBC37DRAFT_378248 [Rhypophila decipiens]|uniref:Uncharacterized protein n=1 Tax=Rhypophila decipiens TaxID=261697 RepID=A0AAN6XYX5_9PEZI|nr:hypothetical protein QBC37DRAFT_378248 [Rhypophila decipiens]